MALLPSRFNSLVLFLCTVIMIWLSIAFKLHAEVVIESDNTDLIHYDDFKTGDEAQQRCLQFSSSYGYTSNYCHYDGVNPLWWAGNLRGPDNIFHFGRFSFGKCPPPTFFNVSTANCGNDQQKGTPPPMACQGNPINISIGNKFQSESDFQASGTSALSFTRTYNSLDGIWRHGYSTFLRLAIGKLSLVRADGRETFYTVTDTAITPDATELGSLSKNSDGTWVYTADTNETFVFDSTGRMTNWSSLDGKTLQFSYSGSQVTVTDQLGKTLTYTEDSQHQPLTMTTPGTQVTYAYDANKHLSQLTRTHGSQTEQRQFLYEDTRNNSLLTGIIDERGTRYATWSYDAQGRAISSEHSGGAEHIGVTYNSNGTSTVTNELGKSTIYSFVNIDGVQRVTAINGQPSPNCPASNSTYTYNSTGQPLTKTDAEGIITQYTYNPLGLETQRIEGVGSAQPRTTNTEWDPSRFLRTKVAGPTHTTVYTYDAQGRQLTQITIPNSPN